MRYFGIDENKGPALGSYWSPSLPLLANIFDSCFPVKETIVTGIKKRHDYKVYK
jgi:hypothetical protein